MISDLALAFRSLRRRPGFAAAAIVTLTLGIGASTAIFSVAYGIAFRPLSYTDPDRLIRIYEQQPAEGLLEHDGSLAAFQAWREGAPSIESAALFGKPETWFLAGPDFAPLTMASVSPGFFDVLGVRPVIGSGFKLEQDYTVRIPYREDAVISHEAWQRLFGGRQDVVGQTITLKGVVANDYVYRVVGVMPAGFLFGPPVDMWQPTRLVSLPMKPGYLSYRTERVVARLRAGASVEGARAELRTIAARLARQFPTHSAGWSATAVSLRDATIGRFGRASWLMMAAVAVVLLITCMNVGGLLVARGVARERESAVRTALGAGSWQLFRLWLAEALVLAMSGASLALLIALWTINALKAAAPAGIPRLAAVSVDLPALVMTAASTGLALIFFTLVPSRTRRGHLVDGLRAGSSGAGDSAGQRFIRNALTFAQCGGAATLVVLALVLTRSFLSLMAVDLGWNPERIVTMKVRPPMTAGNGRPWPQYVDWSDRLVRRLEATRGIERAALTSQVPLMPTESYSFTFARGRGKDAGGDARWTGIRHSVTDGYFRAMDIRVVSGRTFDRGDRFTAAQLIGDAPRDHGVAVVTESTARMLWPDRQAIGEALWEPGRESFWWQVIGVVEDIQFYSVGETPVAHVFVPWTQYPIPNPHLIVGGTASIATIREAVGAVEPGTHVEQIAPLESLVSRATAQPRFTMRLVISFALLALLLAAVGIYGTLSYVVRSRTREIGIRMALGASRGGIMADVIRCGIMPAIAGGVVGLGGAFALVRTFRALLFGVAPADPDSFVGAAIALLLVALAAALGPAVRASRVDPAVALRAE